MYYLKTKEHVVQCVEDLLGSLNKGSALTMIISRGASEAYFVRTVTDASSEDIVALLGNYYLRKLSDT